MDTVRGFVARLLARDVDEEVVAGEKVDEGESVRSLLQDPVKPAA